MGAPISSNDTMSLGRLRDGRAVSTPDRKAARKISEAAATRKRSRSVTMLRRSTVG